MPAGPAPAREARSGARTQPAVAPVRPTTVGSATLRLGGTVLSVPLVRTADGALLGDLTSYGLRRGGVLLTTLDPAAQEVSGPVTAPFVVGTARVPLDASGAPTGLVLHTDVSVLGTVVASLDYAEHGWNDASLPVPQVALDGPSAQVTVAAAGGTMTVDTGVGPLAVDDGLSLLVPTGSGPEPPAPEQAAANGPEPRAPELPAPAPVLPDTAGPPVGAQDAATPPAVPATTSEGTAVEAPVPVPAEGAVPEPAEVELLVPPAPAAPGPEQQARARAVGGAAAGAARAVTALPTPQESTGEARGAVTPPDAEAVARAQAELTEALGRRPEPDPALLLLCDRIRASIRAKRPVDEDDLVRARPDEMARDSGEALSTAVEGDAARVRGSYDALAEGPEAGPVTPGTPVSPPATVTPPSPDAPRAAPDLVPAADVSLDADRAAVEQRIADARIERPASEPITAPPFSDVREGREELGQLAESRPGEVLARQDEALQAARGDMAALQAQALAALTASRTRTVTGTGAQQDAMVGSEEQTRESVSRQAQAVFDDAQVRVEGLLAPLTRTAMATWTAGVERHAQEFKDVLAEVQRWIAERHSGIGGGLLAGWDALTGLPGWVVRAYDGAERTFGDRVCALLLEISRDVEAVVAAAEAVIEDARSRIDTLFTLLPAELQDWADEQRASFAGRLDGLQQRVTTTRQDFTRDLSERAVSAVAEVQREVEQLRTEARGVLGRIVDAVGAFLDDPVRAVINGLLSLVGIPPASFWALVDRIAEVAAQIAEDPVPFVNNLVAALRAGFEGFFERFPQHLLRGFFDWLFSALGSVGVQLPRDTSPGSLVVFALQLMGITWPRVREILVRHVGERNVALVEQVWELVSTLAQRGPEGLFEMVRERLDPAAFVQQVLDAAVQYVVETLVEQVAARVLMLFNPAGAVVQAIELVYRVLRWIFENAARLFRFVETVVGAMADLLAGNITGTARAVERSLAMLLPPVIDFLAGYLGLGDLPQRVADVIKGLQGYVLGVLDAVIGWLVTRGRALLQALGLGGGDGGPETGDTELGVEVRFSGGQEQHRLWVDRQGTAASLMVASREQPLSVQLDTWQAAVQAADPQDVARRETAPPLLASARALLGQADAEADALAPAYAGAASGGAAVSPAGAGATTGGAAPAAPAVPDDAALEAKERQLGALLAQLFGIFDSAGREAALGHVRTGLPDHGKAYDREARDAWQPRLDRVQYVAVLPDERRPLFAGASLGQSPDATTLVHAAETHEELLGYFLQGVQRRSAATAEFRDYAFAPVRLRPRFLDAVAEPAVRELRRAAHANLQTAPQKYRDAWTERLAETLDSGTGFDPRSGRYGRLELPAESPPPHSLWEPQLIAVDDEATRPGYRQTRYTTSTGQVFTVSAPVTEGVPYEITGENLMLWQGRGRTDRSPGYVPNQRMNAAHLIANRFTGSGFETGGNLVSTSDTYNQRLMAAKERAVVREIRAFARDNGREAEDVRFTMTVRVHTGELAPSAVVADLERSWFGTEPADETVRALIRSRLAEEIDTQLRRVLQVDWVYVLSFPDPGAPSVPGSQSLTLPDLWFRIDY